jgi:glucose-6-phosphate 1-dehydrogenase
MNASELTELIAEGGSCVLDARPGSCAIVIFGGSGDLTSRKLFPALARLFEAKRLPERFAIVAAARSRLDDAAYRERMRLALVQAGGFDTLLAGAWPELAQRIYYCPVEYEAPEQFQRLAERMTAIELEQGLNGERVYYLAVPPQVYGDVAENLGKAGMAHSKRARWRRLVVEKPFGHDLASARALDQRLHAWFEEPQLFRIDHYLAKETVQNIALLRFANAVFEPVWNRNYVEYVSILSAETLGVEHRAGYYDAAGVLRDMFQNHMLQLMSLAAMEPPSIFAADRVRDEKAKVFRSLRPFNLGALDVKSNADIALGQYATGKLNGKPVPGYREEPNVPPGSVTPTFAMLRVFVDNWRWQGTPFYLASGKRLASKLTRIVVQFKEAPHSMFRALLGEHIAANRLIIECFPEQAIDMSFQVKQPGPRLCLRPATLSYAFGDEGGPILDAYEKVLLDCMLGDQTLFLRQDAVELSWGFLTPILDMCASCRDLDKRLLFYPAGGWGPEQAKTVHLNYLRDVSRARKG